MSTASEITLSLSQHSHEAAVSTETMPVPMDTTSFDQFYAIHSNAIFAFLQRYLANYSDAEDCFQSTWLAVAKHFDHVHNHPKPIAWLYRIARNKATDYARRRQNQIETVAHHDMINDVGGLHGNPESTLSCNELAADLEASIRGMSAKVRIAYHLRIECDLAFKAISEMLDEPVERIAGRVRVALQQLQQVVDQHRSLS